MPNSLLWIGLVAVWLFVLVPMLVNRREPVRRTGDAALSTRVLHRGGLSRVIRRGPSTGHASDPDWRPEPVAAKLDTESPKQAQHDDAVAVDDSAEGDGADVSEDAAAAVDSGDDRGGEDSEDRRATADADREADPADSAGDEFRRAAREVPARAVPAPEVRTAVRPRRGRGGFDPEADAAARALRYSRRRRVVLTLLILAVLTAGLGVATTGMFFWLHGIVDVMLVLYLAYLRRQVRIEQEIRRRRMARLARARDERRAERSDLEITAELRRVGAVVLEVDDEDPVFEHLDPYRPRLRGDLPRASGQ